MAGLLDFLSPESRQGNRQWLDNQNAAIAEALRYYLGPTGIPDRLGLLAESTPTAGLERAGTESSRMFAPGLSGWDRMAAAGNMLSETAGAGAGLLGMPAAGMVADDLVEAAAPAVGRFMRGDEGTLRYRRDASDIFGAGTQRAMYDDPATGGYMEMLERPSGPASVLELFVPEGMRGQGGGKRLLEEVMQNNPRMMGQVSSKAAAKTAYAAGRRPADMPNATLDDVFRMIDEDSSVNLVSPAELEARGLLSTVATDAAAQQGREIINLLRSGRAGEVTEQMLDMGDPVLNARLSEYLYGNYDLPMDYESRMGRAIQSGFDVNDEMYRGDAPRQAFDTGIGQRDQIGVTASSVPDVAASYIPARGEGGIYPLVSRGQNDAVIEAGGQNWNVILPNTPVRFQGETDRLDQYIPVDQYFEPYDVLSGTAFFDTNDLSRIFQGYGADRVRFNDLVDRGSSARYYGPQSSLPSDVTMVANPANVRSRFARFDPRLSHLRNLNAAITAGVPVGLLAMQPDQGPQ